MQNDFFWRRNANYLRYGYEAQRQLWARLSMSEGIYPVRDWREPIWQVREEWDE